MPQLTPRDLHVDRLLTAMSVGYQNASYIADLIFPLVPVEKQSDLIPVFTKSDWFRSQSTIRAPRTAANVIGYSFHANKTYFAQRYSIATEISDDERANADAVDAFSLDRDSTDLVTDQIMLGREVAFAGAFFKTGVWATDVAHGGVNTPQWSDYANSTPLQDMTTHHESLEPVIGRMGNTFVTGKKVWNALKWHPDIIDTMVSPGATRGMVTQDKVRELFEVDRLLIGNAIYTTSPEGTAESSVTYTRIWGSAGLLMYVTDRPRLRTPTAGYTFLWQVAPNTPQYIKRFREEKREVDVIECNTYYDQRIISSDAGVFLNSLVA